MIGQSRLRQQKFALPVEQVTEWWLILRALDDFQNYRPGSRSLVIGSSTAEQPQAVWVKDSLAAQALYRPLGDLKGRAVLILLNNIAQDRKIDFFEPR